MSNTIFPAIVEVSHKRSRGAIASVDVISSSQPGTFEVFQNNLGELNFRAEVSSEFNRQKHTGTAYVTVHPDHARTLVRNLAKRLGMEVSG